jgi:hypothetical protein
VDKKRIVKWIALAMIVVIAGIFILINYVLSDCKNSEAGWECRFKIPFIDRVYREKCNIQGGLWKCYGMCGFTYTRFCDLPLNDAGKECTNSEQCEGSCVVEQATIEKQYPDQKYAWEINCTTSCPVGRYSKGM